MAKLYPPYIEGTLPAFCLTIARQYDELKSYNKNDLVYVIEDGEKKIYRSLVNNNSYDLSKTTS